MFLHASHPFIRQHQSKDGFVLRSVFVLFAGLPGLMVLMVLMGLGASFTASAQKTAAVQYWMDVATLTVSGITNTASAQDAISTDALGQLTGNTSTQFGGTKGMQPGRWLDVALAVPADSAKAAGGALSVLQIIPKGQNMGDKQTTCYAVQIPASNRLKLSNLPANL